jgi:protocatechuate 3,4-dioxygenase beta subunit
LPDIKPHCNGNRLAIEQMRSKFYPSPSEKRLHIKTCIIFALTIVIANSIFAQQALYCSGTVRYPSGAPAPGVRVEYYPGHHGGAGQYAEVMTDANGRYEIIEQKDVVIYNGEIIETNSIMARDVERNLAAVREFHMATTNVDLVLQPAIILSGSVKNTEGVPIVGAELDLGFWDRMFHKLGAQRVKINELGQFSIPALPQGREYEIIDIAAKGYGSGGERLLAKDTRTNRYEFPTFVLKHADLKIAGRVLDEAGKPLAGAKVYFMGKGQSMNSEDKWRQQPWCNTKTDGEGKFSFDTVCDAPLRIYADYHDPLNWRISTNLNGGGGMPAQPGDTNIVIRLTVPNK